MNIFTWEWRKIGKIFALIIFIISLFLIRLFFMKPILGDESMITIDALITSSTIAFSAFMNYSANGSGSSIATRKLNWSNFNISTSASKTLKFLNIFMFPFTNNMVFLISFSVLFSTLTPFASLFPKIILSTYLFVSVSFSGLILLGILYRYTLFNSEPYKYSSEIFIEKASKIAASGNKEKIKSFGRTYLNILRSTKNITILNEFAKKLNIHRDKEEFRILMKKFINIIIENDLSPKEEAKIYISLFYYHLSSRELRKTKISKITKNYSIFLSLTPEEYKEKYKANISFIMRQTIENHLENKH